MAILDSVGRATLKTFFPGVYIGSSGRSGRAPSTQMQKDLPPDANLSAPVVNAVNALTNALNENNELLNTSIQNQELQNSILLKIAQKRGSSGLFGGGSSIGGMLKMAALLTGAGIGVLALSGDTATPQVLSPITPPTNKTSLYDTGKQYVDTAINATEKFIVDNKEDIISVISDSVIYKYFGGPAAVIVDSIVGDILQTTSDITETFRFFTRSAEDKKKDQKVDDDFMNSINPFTGHTIAFDQHKKREVLYDHTLGAMGDKPDNEKQQQQQIKDQDTINSLIDTVTTQKASLKRIDDIIEKAKMSGQSPSSNLLAQRGTVFSQVEALQKKLDELQGNILTGTDKNENKIDQTVPTNTAKPIESVDYTTADDITFNADDMTIDANVIEVNADSISGDNQTSSGDVQNGGSGDGNTASPVTPPNTSEIPSTPNTPMGGTDKNENKINQNLSSTPMGGTDKNENKIDQKLPNKPKTERSFMRGRKKKVWADTNDKASSIDKPGVTLQSSNSTDKNSNKIDQYVTPSSRFADYLPESIPDMNALREERAAKDQKQIDDFKALAPQKYATPKSLNGYTPTLGVSNFMRKSNAYTYHDGNINVDMIGPQERPSRLSYQSMNGYVFSTTNIPSSPITDTSSRLEVPTTQNTPTPPPRPKESISPKHILNKHKKNKKQINTSMLSDQLLSALCSDYS